MSILKNFVNPWGLDTGVLDTGVLDTDVLKTSVLDSVFSEIAENNKEEDNEEAILYKDDIGKGNFVIALGGG
jgi:hypothetical protein